MKMILRLVYKLQTLLGTDLGKSPQCLLNHLPVLSQRRLVKEDLLAEVAGELPRLEDDTQMTSALRRGEGLAKI